jgi:hypothetical protein
MRCDGTQTLNELDKLAEYRALPARPMIMFFWRRSAHALVWRRDGGVWLSTDSRNDEARVLAHFGFAVLLAELYHGVTCATA